MIRPTKWSSVKNGGKVTVNFPHKDALVDPTKYGVIVQRPGTVVATKSGRATVHLESGGVIEVKSLDALMVEEEKKEKVVIRPYWDHQETA